MSNITETILKVDSREKHGTSLSKKLRSQGRIPAVFYGKDILKHYSVDDSKFRASNEILWWNPLAHRT